MHGELLVPPTDNKAIFEASNTVRVDSIPLHDGSNGMQDMFNEVFAMHDVCVEAGGSQVGVEAEAEAEAESVEAEIEDSNKEANKLDDLLKHVLVVGTTQPPWLTYGTKWCFMGHRRWLPPNHQWRRNKRQFNGTQEMDSPHEVLNGNEIMRQLECVVKRARTGQKLPSGEVDWKK